MKEVGARDRLVMAGLVVLGLLTVIAGVLSGRSTIDYVLARDAREAALSWATALNSGTSEQPAQGSPAYGQAQTVCAGYQRAVARFEFPVQVPGT